jgi:tetratricopeptide (TPR) repeat protein
MQLPDDRYTFSRTPRGYGSRKSRGGLTLSIFLIIISLVIGIVSLSRIVEINVGGGAHRDDILLLWEQRSYEEINTLCDEILAESPLNMEARIFNGFAYFYRGVAKFTLEDKIPLYNEAVKNLRIADLESEYPLKGSVRYILAKTYYHKGRYFADLAIEYMKSAQALGYFGDDSFEYLGLAYSELGEYELSVEYFEKALERNPSDTLYLVLGQTYFTMEDFSKSEEILLRCLNATDDIAVQQKARFLLGKIHFDRGDFLKAEQQYREVLSINPASADAHYNLGSIYDALNDTIKARAEWRKALEIDPTHHGARQKLYN